MDRLGRFLPILHWGRAYVRHTLISDGMAAVIVTIMLIPQSLAYAMLAGLVMHRLSDAGVALHLSEVKGPVMDRLERSDFLHHLTGQVHLSHFHAVEALAPAGHSAGATDRATRRFWIACQAPDWQKKGRQVTLCPVFFCQFEAVIRSGR